MCETSWMKEHLEYGWRLAGAEVFAEYHGTTMGRGWDKDGTRAHRDRNAHWRKRATELAEDKGLDLVFIVAYDDDLEAKTLKTFRNLGAKVALYHVDMLSQWYRIIKSAPLCNVVCHAEDDHVDFFQRKGIPLYRLPMAAIPPETPPDPEKVIQFDGVLYLGSPWPYRKMAIKKLVAQGVPTRVYGHNWSRRKPFSKTHGNLHKTLHDMWFYLLPRLREEGLGRITAVLKRRLSRNRKPLVSDDDLPAEVIQNEYLQTDFTALVRGASINLGFSQMDIDWTKEYPRMIRLRDFEVPMHGGFYLAQNCRELGQYFELGKEIAVWETMEDLVDACRYYLARPQERADITAAGHRRAIMCHTWLARFAGLVQHLGMRLPNYPENISRNDS